MSITDARGTIHSTETPAQRIVSLVPSTTETLFRLGVADKVVGVTRFCVHPKDWVHGLPKIGGTKDIELEKVLALEPDLVIGNCEENTREIFDALDPHVKVWAPLPKTIEDAIADLSHVGTLVGAEEKANQWVNDAQAILRHARTHTEPFTYAYLIWNDPLMSISDDTFIAEMLRTVGGENVFEGHADRFPSIDTDEIRDLNPDVVLLSSEPFPFKQRHRDQLAQSTGLPPHRIRFINGEYASWHGVRMVDGLQYLHNHAPDRWDSYPK
jgi:ABC-type Fe3+-hydroxamate transport system substrate-binding protein